MWLLAETKEKTKKSFSPKPKSFHGQSIYANNTVISANLFSLYTSEGIVKSCYFNRDPKYASLLLSARFCTAVMPPPPLEK